MVTTISKLLIQILMYAHHPGCALGRVVTSKNVHFIAGHHGLPGVHVMHHRANTDVCTLSLRWCRTSTSGDIKDVFS